MKSHINIRWDKLVYTFLWTCIIIITASTAFVHQSGAAIIVWDANGADPPNGNFHYKYNWEPDVTPLAGDSVQFVVDKTYTVSFTANADSDKLEVTNGNVSFASSSSATRTYNLTSGAMDLYVSSGAILNVGAEGLPVVLNVGDMISVGNGSSGEINVSETGSQLNSTSSNLHYIGLNGGTGVLTYQNNAAGSITGAMNIGCSINNATSGTLNLSSGAELTTANLQVGSGSNGSATGTINLSDARLTQSGASTLTIGSAAGNYGYVYIEPNSTFNSGTSTGTTVTINARGELHINQGTFNANGNVNVNGGTITRTVGANDFNLAVGRTLNASNNAQLNMGNNAALSGGTNWNILSGSDIYTTSGWLNIGASNGTTTVIVDGAGSSIASPSGSSAYWGYNGNTANVTFRNGSTGNIGLLKLGYTMTSGSTGILRIESGSQFTCGDLSLAFYSASTITASLDITGTGSALTQNGDASLSVGSGSIGSAIITVADGGQITSGTGDISIKKTGQVNLTGGGFTANGNIIIDGGTMSCDATSTLSILKSFTVQNNAQATFQNKSLHVNDGNTYALESGADMTVTGGGVHVGDTSAGTLLVDGVGTTLVGGSAGNYWGANTGTANVTLRNGAAIALPGVGMTNLGSNSTATVRVESGATVSSGGMTIANSGTGNNTSLTITGAGSRWWNGSSTLTLGHDINNSAIVYVYDQGLLDVGATVLNRTGSIYVNGGHADLGNLTDNGGLIYFYDAGAVSVDNNFLTSALVESSYNFNLGSLQQLSVGGTTSVESFHKFTLAGGTLTTGNLVVDGVLDFQAGTISITGTDGLVIGSTGPFGSSATFGAGKILNVTNTATIQSSSLLLMENGGVFNAGSLANSGEIVLGGDAAMLGGTSLNNLAGGIVRGNGQISANLSNANGAEIRAEAGNRLHFTGINNINQGRLKILDGILEFSNTLTNGANGQILGRGMISFGGTGLINQGNVNLSGGITDVFGNVSNNTGSASKGISISANSDVKIWDGVTHTAGSLFRVSADSSVTFFGNYSGAGITGDGDKYFEADVTPGASPAVANFEGNVYFGPAARLEIEIGGPTPGSNPNNHDQVNIASTVNLDGTLELKLIGGFIPAPGDMLTVMNFAARNGTFAQIISPTEFGIQFIPMYSADKLVLLTSNPGEKIWAVDAGGSAAVGANWIGGIAPGGLNDKAAFTNMITASRTVTFDTPTTVGSLRFDDDNNYTLAGPGPIVLDVSAGNILLHIANTHGNGSHLISAPIQLNDDLVINQQSSGTFTLTGTITNSSGKHITKNGLGVLSIEGSQNWGSGAAAEVGQGKLRFALDSTDLVELPADASITVNSFATLELAGVKSALSDGMDHADVLNNIDGTLLVSGTNQAAGSVTGQGNTMIQPDTDLTLESIQQNTLTIGPGGKLTIRPLITEPISQGRSGIAGAANLSPVPEPATALLLVSAFLVLLIRRKI